MTFTVNGRIMPKRTNVARSTTYRNLALIRKETGVNTFVVPARKVREAVPLRERREMESLMEDTTIISAVL